MYRVQIVKSAIKELSKLPTKEALKITRKINHLKDEPRPSGCIKLTGSDTNIELESEIIEFCILSKIRFY